jgi:hypothetical protein
MKTTPDNITELAENEIFVFGSNLAGRHGKGAAKDAAKKFGARYGIGIGLCGQTYAIPTKGSNMETLSVNVIRNYTDGFFYFARKCPQLHFLVTKVGCGLAGHSPEQIAPLFKDCLGLANVSLPEEFIKILNPS